MSWQLGVALHLLLSTAFALLQRSFAKKYSGNAVLSTALMYIFVVSPLGIGGALLIGDISFDISWQAWGLLGVAGTLFALANIAAFDANTHVDAGQFNIIGNLRAFTTIVASSVLLNETLDPQQWLGIAIIVGSAVLIASTRFNPETRRIDRHTLIAIASAVLFGLAFTNEKWLLDNMTFSTYLIIGWGLQTIAMSMLAAKYVSSVHKTVSLDYAKWLGAMGAIRTLAGFALVFALKESGNSSLVASIISYKTALVVVGAYFILKEHDHAAQKFGGAVMATVGLWLLV